MKDFFKKQQRRKGIFLFMVAMLFLILFFTGCPDPDPPIPTESPTDAPTTEITPEPTPTVPAPTPNTTPVGDVLFSLYDGEKLMYYDGENITIAYESEAVKTAGRAVHSIDDVLYHFDSRGVPILLEWLPTIPDVIAVKERTESRDPVYQDETWTLEDISPEEAYAMGAQYKHYTRVYEDAVEVGLWNLNEWQVDDVIIPLCGNVIAIDVIGAYHNLTGVEEVFRATDSGLMIHSINQATKTGLIKTDAGNHTISWALNFFLSAKWQRDPNTDTWYSHNGYRFSDDVGLEENFTAMTDWQTYPYPIETIYGESPTLVCSGTGVENELTVLYWTECNTGTLTKYVPAFDMIEIDGMLYIGDGLRQSGVNIADGLDPVIIDDILYFHHNSSIKTYDFSTTAVEVFSGDMELNPWE